MLTITGFQLLLLAGVLLVCRRGEPLQRILLVAFLLTKVLLILRWYLYRQGILTPTTTPYLARISAAGFFLLAPLLFLHVRALCYRNFRLRRDHLLHLLPAVGYAILAALSIRLILTDGTSGSAGLDRILTVDFWNTFWTMNFIQIVIYIAGMLGVLRAYRADLRETHSSVEKFDLGWLKALLTVLTLHWLFIVCRGTLGLLGRGSETLVATLDLFSITIFLVFTTLLVIKGLGQLKLLPGVDERPKPAGPSLPDPALTAHADRLRRYMQDEKPYLEPALTIDELSAGLSLPSWQLSRVVNTCFRQNFCTFVNSYRIAEAQNQLSSSDGGRKTILEILYAAGFQSKSVFNEAFKKETGVTPSEYRKRHLSRRAIEQTIEETALGAQNPEFS